MFYPFVQQTLSSWSVFTAVIITEQTNGAYILYMFLYLGDVFLLSEPHFYLEKYTQKFTSSF